VNRYLSSAASEKAADAVARIGFVGLGEAAQALTLGGFLAFLVCVLRVVAEGRLASRTDR
jgi:hypothetical protein